MGLLDSPDVGVIPNIEMQVSNVRRVLVEQSSNLIALPPNSGAPTPAEGIISPPSRSSGSFPANPNQKKLSPAPIHSPTSPADPTGAVKQSSAAVGNSGNLLKIVIGISSAIFLLILVAVIFLIFRSRAAKTIGPWKTGLSGQLQKAFITGILSCL